jgi:hypothetical protein
MTDERPRRGLLALLAASACLSRTRVQGPVVHGLDDGAADEFAVARGVVNRVVVGAFDVIGPGESSLRLRRRLPGVPAATQRTG